MVDYEVNIFSDSSDSDDDIRDFINILHRRPYIVRDRPNHLQFWDDEDFKNRFRLSKETVQAILQRIENLLRFPAERNAAINPLQQLLICLRFYASGNMLITVGDFAGVHKSSVCHIIRRVTGAICTLRQLYLRLPENDNEAMVVQQEFYRIAAFPRVLLALDCTHVRIQSPGGNQAEQFRNRKVYFSLNIQAACDSNLKFRDIVTPWPEAAHDSMIFNSSYLKARFDEGVFGNALILGNSGYAVSQNLITPLLNPTTPRETTFNEAQIRTRNVIERAFGVWKRRFPVLALGLRLQLETVQDIVVATAILHNIAVEQNEEEVLVNEEVAAIINEAVPLDQLYQNGNGVIRNELINNYFARLV